MKSFVVILAALVFVVGGVFAFTSPALDPPAGNVFAPLNVGDLSQVKSGALTVNTGGGAVGFVVEEGSLGIGTDSPSQLLHIKEDTPGLHPNLRLEDSKGDGIHVGYNTLGDYGALSSNTGGISYWDTLVWKLGNVGIGTTDPEKKLSVAGTIQSTFGGFMFPDRTVQTTAAAGGGGGGGGGGGSGAYKSQVFTTSGVFTVPAGVTEVFVTAVGGGGGGGGGTNCNTLIFSALSIAGGGGGSGYVTLAQEVTGLTSEVGITVTVGTGGAAGLHNIGVPDTNGGTGGVSSFGVLVSAAGGTGGKGGSFTADGGIGNQNGKKGRAMRRSSNMIQPLGGHGGITAFGYGYGGDGGHGSEIGCIEGKNGQAGKGGIAIIQWSEGSGGGGGNDNLGDHTATQNLNIANFDVTGVNKLTVNTIDPVYEIDGVKYATYVADTAGGVKMETTGIAQLKSGIYTINFDEQKIGSNLWLFWQTSSQTIEDIAVFLTPGFEGNIWYTKEPSENRIIIYGTQDGEVSFRLTAPREDYQEWGNEVSK